MFVAKYEVPRKKIERLPGFRVFETREVGSSCSLTFAPFQPIITIAAIDARL